MALKDRLIAAQQKLGLNNQTMAAALRITPEWLSKILNDKAAGSDDIGLRLDDLLRHHGVEPSLIPPGKTVEEPPASYGQPSRNAQLVAELRERFQRLLTAAGDDAERLYWISAQLREHLAIPMGWEKLEEINVRAIIRAEELHRESLRRRGAQSKTSDQSHERSEPA